MAYITSLIVLDTPSSALNNAGLKKSASTDNIVVVKQIRTKEGSHPYVSAQSFRYWLRTTLELNDQNWIAAPIARTPDIAFTEADPITNWDDDLFGYMRAQSSKGDDAKKTSNAESVAKLLPMDPKRELTRVSPLRVGTFVSISPTTIVEDFGVMARQNGFPVIHNHEFYRAELQGLLSLDLTCCGTFFDSEKVGFKNLDSVRREKAANAGLAKVTIRKQSAIQLPIASRIERVQSLIRGLAMLGGGAKQALHYTDVMPAIVVSAITRGGNHPFYRMFQGSRTDGTTLHEAAVTEIFDTFHDEFLSPVYVGWAHGFLDKERAKFETLLPKLKQPPHGFAPLEHPKKVLLGLAEQIAAPKNAEWFN